MLEKRVVQGSYARNLEKVWLISVETHKGAVDTQNARRGSGWCTNDREAVYVIGNHQQAEANCHQQDLPRAGSKILVQAC